jgi:uncharacterized membrane protein YgdD (TMEM256/DUF423 family)
VSVLQTAVQFAMFHSLALLAVTALHRQATRGAARCLAIAAWLFVGGMLLFCGSLALLTLGPFPQVVFAVPVGGTLLMIGWLALIAAAVATRSSSGAGRVRTVE